MARLVAKDLRTTTARNIRVLEREAGLPWLSPAGDIRRELLKKAEVVPNVDRWRLPYLNNYWKIETLLSIVAKEKNLSSWSGCRT